VACGAGNSGSSNRADIVLQTEEPGSNRIGPEFPRRLSIRPSLYFTIDDSLVARSPSWSITLAIQLCLALTIGFILLISQVR